MDLRRFEELLQAWQDAEATPEQLRELERLLREEPALRRELVGSVLIEVGLYRKYTAATSPVAAPAAPRRRRWEAVAAALVLAVSVFLVGRLLLIREPRGPVVVSGDVVGALAPGAVFEVKGLAPATLDLAGGARAILNPGTRARLLPDGTIELLKGDGSFSFPGSVPFSVRTAAGEISGRDARFWMLLRPNARKLPKQELLLDVAQGSVEYRGEFAPRATAVAAGERRLFGPPPPGGEKLNRMLEGTAFPLTGALDRALAAAPGVAIKAELEDENGRTVYSVSIASEGRTREIELDPATGKVLDNELEDEDETAVVSGLKISLKSAVDKALETVPGRAIKAEAELENGRVRVVVRVLGDMGVRQVQLDGTTGEILRK